MPIKRRTYVLVALCGSALISGFAAPSAMSAQSPQWTVTAFSDPTNFAPGSGAGGEDFYTVRVENTGGAPSDGEAITVTDVLPVGLKTTAEPASGLDYESATDTSPAREMSCVGLTCTYVGPVGIDNTLELKIPVEVAAGPFIDSCAVPVGAVGCLTNLVTVSGGAAPAVNRETPTMISLIPASFGIAPGSAATALSSSQAGAHPDLTLTLEFESVGVGLLAGNVQASGLVLPPGFVGDLADTPKCPIAGFSEEVGGQALHCSLSAVVGTVTLHFNLGAFRSTLVRPLLNLTTNPGEVAKLGFTVSTYGIQGTVSLRPGDYAVRTNFTKVQDSTIAFDGISLTVWGVPSESSHDLMRGLWCESIEASKCWYVNETRGGLRPLRLEEAPEGQQVTTPPVPYLTSPTDCTGEALLATFSANSWKNRNTM